MDLRALAVPALCALVLAPAMAAEPGRLDLDVDPAEVAEWDAGPPPHDRVIAPPAGVPATSAPGANEPGWSLRPAVDVDVGEDNGEQAGLEPEGRSLDLGDVTVDLNSVGVRLQQTW